MTARTAAKTKKRSLRTSNRRENLRNERVRMFDPDILPLVRADIAKVHGKPEATEPSIIEFIEEFFDEIHRLRTAKVGWDKIHERISKYVDCSSRTLQSYYNVLAQKRGLEANTEKRKIA